ncbi:hypothetical protein WCX49_00085 [Sulfurimonas sp. HSL-1656]|uniref:peptide methionine sulfoxide reductase n=1 Tax=Thiomicrolovo subterrani TaxID=3131934 RepID=UPI0031F74B9E
MSYREKLRAFPDGAQEVLYEGKRWLMRKETHLEGRLIKLYAEELGGNDFVSLNYYETASAPLLKPCEMPAEKVIAFIEKATLP